MSVALDELIPGIVGLLVTGVPTAYMLRLAWLSLASRRWPSARGRVTRSAVVPGRRDQASYDVRYGYEAYGRRYDGSRVRFGGAISSNRAVARETVNRYPHGSAVTVYYHPRKPNIATLERRASGFLWLWLSIGLFLASAIAGALVGWWD